MDPALFPLLAFAAVILIYQIIKGWRLGFVRQSVRFGAMAAAYLAAVWISPMAVPFLRPLGYPDCILRLMGGVGIVLAVYFFLWLLGALLFKRTSHQSVALAWFLYGALGALMGAAFGLIIVLFATSAIRLIGSAAPVAPVATWKNALESGMPGIVLRSIDPVPNRAYVLAEKLGQTTRDPAALERFLRFSGADQLAVLPEMEALRHDPEVLAAARDGRWQDFLKNETVVRAANSPAVAAHLRNLDLEKALDKALAKPE